MNDKRYPYWIDSHSHILPGLDDGARNFEETEYLLRQAFAEGIRTVIATPHFRPSYWKNTQIQVGEVFEKTRRLAMKISRQLQIYLWNEVYWEEEIIYHLRNGNCRVVGEGFVLIENRPDSSKNTLYEMAELLIANNYTPVFAHVERYQAVRRERKIIEKLKEKGAWIQINTDSMMGKNGFCTAAFCKYLLKYEKIDLLGTDCHCRDFRSPEFRKCIEYVRKNTNQEYFNRLMKNNPCELLKKEE